MGLRRRVGIGLVVTAMLAGLVACGGGGDGKSVGASTADVVAKDSPKPHFDPDTLKAPVGSEVSFSLRNEGKVVHNFTLPFAGVDQDVRPGQTVQIRFTVPQRVKGLDYFTFYDKNYQGQGMQGRLNVS